MHKEMPTPGSIFVHDIHAEKLLVEIVKLLGGSEQHLQRAAEAAKAEIAGLKSPTSAGVAGTANTGCGGGGGYSVGGKGGAGGSGIVIVRYNTTTI